MVEDTAEPVQQACHRIVYASPLGFRVEQFSVLPWTPLPTKRQQDLSGTYCKYIQPAMMVCTPSLVLGEYSLGIG